MLYTVNHSALITSEIVATLAWYRVTKTELNFVLLGASLGLKSQGITDPNLELAITSGQPEIFLGTEVRYEQEYCESTYK
jgi:hypothetical protein